MKRIITGLLVVTGWLALLYFRSFPLFWLVISAVSLIAAHEYFSICLKNEDQTIRPVLLFVTLLPLLATWFQRGDIFFAAYIAALILLGTLTVFRAAQLAAPFDFLVKSAFGATHIGLFCGYIILFMAWPDGAAWLLFLTAITAGSDTGAFFTGKALGKHKLSPAISPGKTVEGFIGGLLCGAACALLVAYILFDDMHFTKLAAAALFLSALGVIGDLIESLIKRSMHVKDSGTILPGHGGILDRVDSLLVTAPVLYYLVLFNLLD